MSDNYQNRAKSLKRMTRRSLLILVSLCCVCVAIFAAAWGCIAEGKTAQENHFREILTTYSRIENISFEGFEEEFGLYDILTVSFTIRGKPNSCVTLLPDGESDLDSLRLLQIGELSPVMFEWDPNVKLWSPRPPTLGNDPKYRPPLPWPDMDLSKLVSRYDEVVEYFSNWPVPPKADEITTDGGLKVQSRVDPANASTMKAFVPPGD